MNELHPTIQLVDGYDKKKNPRVITFRRFTLEDIKTELTQYRKEFWFETRQGNAKRCRQSSTLKTWKTDPTRFECSFKYGMYESFRLSTAEMLSTLLIEV